MPFVLEDGATPKEIDEYYDATDEFKEQIISTASSINAVVDLYLAAGSPDNLGLFLYEEIARRLVECNFEPNRAWATPLGDE